MREAQWHAAYHDDDRTCVGYRPRRSRKSRRRKPTSGDAPEVLSCVRVKAVGKGDVGTFDDISGRS
jgi:hypothetical protein